MRVYERTTQNGTQVAATHRGSDVEAIIHPPELVGADHRKALSARRFNGAIIRAWLKTWAAREGGIGVKFAPHQDRARNAGLLEHEKDSAFAIGCTLDAKG